VLIVLQSQDEQQQHYSQQLRPAPPKFDDVTDHCKDGHQHFNFALKFDQILHCCLRILPPLLTCVMVYFPQSAQERRKVVDIGLLRIGQNPASVKDRGDEGSLEQDEPPRIAILLELEEERVDQIDDKCGEDEEIGPPALEGPVELGAEESSRCQHNVVESEGQFAFFLLDDLVDGVIFPPITPLSLPFHTSTNTE
jgi:hypothetical protein